jgi:adenosylcobinamide-GDP ribazoletransferase
MEPDVVLVAALWCMSRAAMAVALARVPYVGGGLGTAFAGASRWPGAVAAGGVAVGGAAAAVAQGIAGAAAAVALVAVVVAVVALGRSRLGGVTGDVLGAAGVAAESVALVVATASW